MALFVWMVYFLSLCGSIIFNHSHTCLSLKIVLTLPGRLFLVNTALPEPCVFHLPSGSRDSRDWLWLISLLPCVDTPEFFLRVHRALLVRGLDFTSRAHLLTQVTESVALPAMSRQPFFLPVPASAHKPCHSAGVNFPRGEPPTGPAVSDLWVDPANFWNGIYLRPVPQHGY